MNFKNILTFLEFYENVKELKEIGLTDIEIEGFFDFEWECEKDILSLLGDKENDVQN